MRALAPLVLALALALSVSACDKCGDWVWQHGAKSCHGEAQPN